MSKTSILFAALALAITALPAQSEESMKDIRIIVKTDKGDIEGVLYPSKAPVTVANFLNLAKRGYYNGLKFHRVIQDQVVRAATARGFETLTVASNTSAEVPDAALALLAQRVEAICQAGSNVTTSAFASIAQSARRAGVPVFGFLSGDLPAGAAVVVARDYVNGGHEAGLMAACIMRGASPATIPFQPLRTTRLLVNLDAARASGLTVPAAVVQRAHTVIGK